MRCCVIDGEQRNVDIPRSYPAVPSHRRRSPNHLHPPPPLRLPPHRSLRHDRLQSLLGVERLALPAGEPLLVELSC